MRPNKTAFDAGAAFAPPLDEGPSFTCRRCNTAHPVSEGVPRYPLRLPAWPEPRFLHVCPECLGILSASEDARRQFAAEVAAQPDRKSPGGWYQLPETEDAGPCP